LKQEKPDAVGEYKRDLLQCQKRPITVSKETYYSVKRDLLLMKQEKPDAVGEYQYQSERDLLVSKET
jgi:hypothetical protein